MKSDSSPMLEIYGRTTSFNVQKVLWFLDELAVSYEHVQLGGRFGGLDTEAFAAMNPLCKVPVLVNGDKSIWESHTILRYLADVYGQGQWWSADPFIRSQYERWMDWSQSVFQPAFMGVFWGHYRKPPHKRNMNAVLENRERCVAYLAVLNEQLHDTEYLGGDAISLADIPAGSALYRLTEIGLDIMLPTHVERWYQLLRERAGYQKWIMSDFTELHGREDF